MISSITGATAVLIVTEPTLSGVHDLERVAELAANHFNIPTFVCVNKYDLNPEICSKIETYCRKNKMHFAGKIPYDDQVTKAMVAGKNIIEFSNGELSNSIRNIWNKIQH